MTRSLLVALLVLAAAPAAAVAQDPATIPPQATPTPTPTPEPPPPPKPKPKLALGVTGTLKAGHADIELAGKQFKVTGSMTPTAAHEKVRLRLSRDGKIKRTLKARVKADGTFRKTIKAGGAGRVSIRVLHRATAAVGKARGPKVSVQVVRPALALGASGPLVRLLQKGLAKLHYAVPRNDHFDAATGRAVMAFRKVNGMARRYDADRRVIEKVLAGKGTFKVRHPEAGHHVEADLSLQVLTLIDGDKVRAIYHTSSGAPATPTVIGTFRVYLKTPGTNAKGMVHSSYFIRGYAIHGYFDVPAFNASHGCLRVPIPDAWHIFQWVHMGDEVIVYP